jgi:DNA polymerase-3 subunit epsilon
MLGVRITGLDPRKDEVIELGMVKFDYLPDGRVGGVKDVFSSFNEPSVPIPTEVTALTGITDQMVGGHPSMTNRVLSHNAKLIIAVVVFALGVFAGTAIAAWALPSS